MDKTLSAGLVLTNELVRGHQPFAVTGKIRYCRITSDPGRSPTVKEASNCYLSHLGDPTVAVNSRAGGKFLQRQKAFPHVSRENRFSLWED